MNDLKEFEYHATDSSGRVVSGRVTSQDPEAALENLRDNGLQVISLTEKGAGRFKADFCGKIRPEDFIGFNEQLASMTKTGLPLPESLNAIARDMEEGRFKAALQDVVSDMRAGQSLSQSLRRRDDVFSDLYIGLVKAGEASGHLSGVLSLTAQQAQGLLRVRTLIAHALLYPTVILFVMMAIYVCLSLFVVPGLEELWVDIGQEGGPTIALPPITRFVLFASKPQVVFPVCFTGTLILALLWMAGPRTAIGRGLLARASMFIVPLHQMVFCYEMSRVFTILTILLRAGVPLRDALGIVAGSCPNKQIAGGIAQAATGVSEGGKLSDALRIAGIFSDSLVWRVSASETTGDIPGACAQISRTYEAKAENLASILQQVFDPMLIIFCSCFIGLFAIGVQLPLIELMERLRGCP